MLLPELPCIEKPRNVEKVVIAEFKIGRRWDDNNEEVFDFLARCELKSFGGYCEPNIWDRILGVFRAIIPARFFMLSCYTPEGFYIGNLQDASNIYYNWKLSQVQPISVALGGCTDTAIKEKSACSIGFDEKKQQWLGWSHRAAMAYGIGYVVPEDACETSSGWTDEYLEQHPEKDLSIPVGFEVKTLEDARRCAIAFAESVD
jgi:hypothetical protein